MSETSYLFGIKNIDNYIIFSLFIVIGWLSSLQILRLTPHGINKSKQIILIHIIILLLSIFEIIINIIPYTQLSNINSKFNKSINNNNNNNNDIHLSKFYPYWRILLILSFPSHWCLWITNFIFFIWLKIYYSVGVSNKILIRFRNIVVIIFSISFIYTLGCIIITHLSTEYDFYIYIIS